MAEHLLLTVIVVAVAVEAVVLSMLLVAFVRHRRRELGAGTGGAAASAHEAPQRTGGNMEDVFLLHRSGLLLKHYTVRMRPNMDSDVLSGMLVAVQEFIKDSFRGEAGSLDEIQFGDLRIKLLEGKWTIIAGLVRGMTTASHEAQMKLALRDLEERYEDLLIDWDGTMDRIPEVDRIMMRLVEGGYRAPAVSQASA